jgi:hypothetical protein
MSFSRFLSKHPRFASIVVLLGALFTWSFYVLLHELAGSLLLLIGISGRLEQAALVVLATGILLILFGRKVSDLI